MVNFTALFVSCWFPFLQIANQVDGLDRVVVWPVDPLQMSSPLFAVLAHVHAHVHGRTWTL